MRYILIFIIIISAFYSCSTEVSNESKSAREVNSDNTEQGIFLTNGLTQKEDSLANKLNFDSLVCVEFKEISSESYKQLKVEYLDTNFLDLITSTSELKFEQITNSKIKSFREIGYSLFIVEKGYKSPHKIALAKTTKINDLTLTFKTGLPSISNSKLNKLLNEISNIASFEIIMINTSGLEGRFDEPIGTNASEITEIIYPHCPDLVGYYGDKKSMTKTIKKSNTFNLWWD